MIFCILNRANISLDTLKPERFRRITRCGSLTDTLEGIEAALAVGLTPLKINAVVMDEVNDDEITDFAEKTVKDGWNVRFIELMPSSVNEPVSSKLVSVSEMKKRIEAMGSLEPASIEAGNGPARYFRFPGAKGTIGFISPVTDHFCFQCNRLRLTADGKLRPCLLSDAEIDLKDSLRNGAPPEELKNLIRQAIISKPKGHTLAEGSRPKVRPFSQVGG